MRENMLTRIRIAGAAIGSLATSYFAVGILISIAGWHRWMGYVYVAYIGFLIFLNIGGFIIGLLRRQFYGSFGALIAIGVIAGMGISISNFQTGATGQEIDWINLLVTLVTAVTIVHFVIWQILLGRSR